ncbi:MAG TPA: peptide chain release factor 2 [Candidatus Saccharimonadales bacterium]|nr:peptide chain release factor 2 [Candidatus Saccharimonadales bacterium]
MIDINSKAKDLASDFEIFKKSFGVNEKEEKVKSLTSESLDPDLWNDQNKARQVMQDLADIKNELEEVKGLEEEIKIVGEVAATETGDDLIQELNKIEARFNKIKLKTYLSSPNDKKNAILSIHAGQGGTEAMDWSSMLYRMYLRFAERRGWKTDMLDETRGEEAGVKSVVLRVAGPYAYGYLKGEAGTHRLVRQSPFNADKLRQTSFALVEVLPEFEDVDLPDIQVKDEDLEWQFYRAGSQGGQNVNKVSTAVRLKHIPSGIVVTSQNERFQEQNRKIALNLLRAKLWIKSQEEAKQTEKDIKGEYRPASWGMQIRSYVLHPYKMVKDLRTEVETGNTDAVMDGEIDEFVEAELKLGQK